MKKSGDFYKLMFIIIYILSIFLIGSLFTLLFGVIVAQARGLEVSGVMYTILKAKGYASSDAEINASFTAQGYGNATSYLIMFVVGIIFMRNDLKDDFFSFKEEKKFFIPYTAIAAVVFTGLAFLISYLIGLAVKESANQTTIVSIMKTNALVPMIISTIIFAPVVEELIYRKCVFHFSRNLRIYVRYIISIVLFTLPHVITSIGQFSVGSYFLMIIPYVIDAFMLALIYHKGKFNIYTSTICHILNNILAIILVFI